jgi:hypothetical protein
MAKPLGALNKRTMLAVEDLNRIGINPIEEIAEAMQFAKKMALKGGNFDSDGKTDQAQWGALWLRGATELAAFKHPKLSALAIKDLRDDAEANAKPLTTAEAVKIIESDPFKKPTTSSQVLDAMQSKIQAPFLPSGGKDE